MRAFRRTTTLAAFCLVTASVFATTPAAMAQSPGKTMTTSSGLQITDSKIGTGATPQPGQICVMHYTGWLYQGGAKGKKFDSSLDRGQPFEFPLGKHQVIAGWDEGVAELDRIGDPDVECVADDGLYDRGRIRERLYIDVQVRLRKETFVGCKKRLRVRIVDRAAEADRSRQGPHICVAGWWTRPARRVPGR